jgi:cytochrome P450
MTALKRPDTEPLDYPFGDHHDVSLEPEFGAVIDNGRLQRVRLPVGGEAWLAASYADVKMVLADPRFSRAEATRPDVARLSPEILPRSSIMAMDPPNHTRLRRVIAAAFTARRVEQLRSRVSQHVEDLIAELSAGGVAADLLDTCESLPLLVICELLGVPASERPTFTSLADVMTSRLADAADISRARQALESFLLHLVDLRRQEPRDDLVSQLVEAMDTRNALDIAELVNLLVALLVGGRGSPAVFLSSSIYLMLQLENRPLWGTLADPVTARQVVEELLRLVPIGVAGGFVRVALEDVDVNGVLVRAGEAVLPAMIAANRDGRVFVEPDTLDLQRAANPHLAFGHGAHHCIGAQLARMMAELFLSGLARAFPDLRLVSGRSQGSWEQGFVVRRLTELKVEWAGG